MKLSIIITLIGFLLLILLAFALIIEDNKLEHCTKTVNLEGEVINFTCEKIQNVRNDYNGNKTN